YVVVIRAAGAFRVEGLLGPFLGSNECGPISGATLQRGKVVGDFWKGYASLRSGQLERYFGKCFEEEKRVRVISLVAASFITPGRSICGAKAINPALANTHLPKRKI
ncbi:MAG: hypothetical protein WBR30_09145, partial [Candidatus Sulfotelmatobacter sp.]